MFTLSSLLITTTLALEGNYKTCPHLLKHRKIDAIMLVHLDLLGETVEGTIKDVQERLIERENQVLLRNLNLEISVKEWIVTPVASEHKGNRKALCSPFEDAGTLQDNLQVFLQDPYTPKVNNYPFWGFVHKCRFGEDGEEGSAQATVVNWVSRIGGNNPEEDRDAKFSYETEGGFGYQYLVRHGASIMGAWHSEKGKDAMQPKARPSRVFSQEEVDWFCDYGFSQDEAAATTEAPPAENGEYTEVKRNVKILAYDNRNNTESYFELSADAAIIRLSLDEDSGKIFSTCPEEEEPCTFGRWGIDTPNKPIVMVTLKKIADEDSEEEEDKIIEAEEHENGVNEEFLHFVAGKKGEFFKAGKYQVSFDENRSDQHDLDNTAFMKITVSSSAGQKCKCPMGDAPEETEAKCTKEKPYRCNECWDPYTMGDDATCYFKNRSKCFRWGWSYNNPDEEEENNKNLKKIGGVKSPDACLKKCKETEECEEWTWKKYIEYCYLKKSGSVLDPDTDSSKGSISGTINSQRCDCFGLGLSYFNPTGKKLNLNLKKIGNIKSAELCLKRCKKTKHCKEWTWRKDIEYCYLKRGGSVLKPDTTSSKGSISGTKNSERCD